MCYLGHYCLLLLWLLLKLSNITFSFFHFVLPASISVCNTAGTEASDPRTVSRSLLSCIFLCIVALSGTSFYFPC